MINNFKDIHIGKLLRQKTQELQISTKRLCNFLNCTEKQLEEMYESPSMDSHNILRWCKLLNYDFFRLFSQHLILYSPPEKANNKKIIVKTHLPQFRKNIYTKELIDFILTQIESQEMTKKQVVTEYCIPKTTLYRWISKHTVMTGEQL